MAAEPALDPGKGRHRFLSKEGPVGVVPREGGAGEVVGAEVLRLDGDGGVEGAHIGHQRVEGALVADDDRVGGGLGREGGGQQQGEEEGSHSFNLTP